jgi:hypothetical protein
MEEHIIEKAKSGRAACRKCRKKITKDELRLGVTMDGDYGSSYLWYHLPCGAQAKADELAQALETYAGEIPDRGELEASIAANKGKKAKAERPFPYAEPAPSGRAACIQCQQKIAKAALRVAVEAEIDTGAFTTVGARYLHPRCALEHIDIDPPGLLSQLSANSDLDPETRAALERELAG